MIAELATSVSGSRNSDLAETLPFICVQASAEQEPAERMMHEFARRSGLPFWCVTLGDEGPRIEAASSDGLALIPSVQATVFRKADGPQVTSSESGLTYYSLPLPPRNGKAAVALGWVRLRPDRRPDELVLAAVTAGWTKRRVDEWLREQPYASPELIQRLLEAAWAQVNAESREQQLRDELINVGEEIEQTYEEITLLHSLTGNLELMRSADEVAELCLSRVRSLTGAEGAAIWMEDHFGGFRLLADGKVPFDERGLARLCQRCDRRDWSRPFVKNRLGGTPLERELPNLRNFVLCSIGDPGQQFGWLIHCNAPREFGSVQASLLQSIARILGTHMRNRELFQQNEDLVMSFVRSMVSTIDAKDAYTRGHSERVALVAKCICEEMGLSTNEIEDVHLSGLLHDIGKVGVDDRILRKETRLNDDEFEQIKKHPEIGCHILAGLSNLERVFPGVRSHHESFDGRGYPDGLQGTAIPLMARIISVADSYDAMGSDRPYRTGLPLERIEAIFRENTGPQWDPQVITAYFAARARIRKLWSAHRPTDLQSLASNSAVGRSRYFSQRAASDDRTIATCATPQIHS
jgi:HD-GYP domain-containing protein (c-di-GMP phosphodiesterase class II)